MLLNNSPFPVTYMKLIISSFASFHKSSGHSSLNWAFLAPTSNIFAWSHNITPVVCVRSSNSIWNGCFLLVFVIGQTNANELWWFKISLLRTSAGLLPLCSWPFWGLKSITIISPCLYVTKFHYPSDHLHQPLACFRHKFRQSVFCRMPPIFLLN